MNHRPRPRPEPGSCAPRRGPRRRRRSPAAARVRRRGGPGPELVQERGTLPVGDHLELGGDGRVQEGAPQAGPLPLGGRWVGVGAFYVVRKRDGGERLGPVLVGGKPTLRVAPGGEEEEPRRDGALVPGGGDRVPVYKRSPVEPVQVHTRAIVMHPATKLPTNGARPAK